MTTNTIERPKNLRICVNFTLSNRSTTRHTVLLADDLTDEQIAKQVTVHCEIAHQRMLGYLSSTPLPRTDDKASFILLAATHIVSAEVRVIDELSNTYPISLSEEAEGYSETQW